MAAASNINTEDRIMGKAIKVKVNQLSVGKIASSETVSVDSHPMTTNRLDTLEDVDADGEISGAAPVYDPDTDTYVIKKLDYTDIDGDVEDIELTEIDGGNF
jgi:hypothetical protein